MRVSMVALIPSSSLSVSRRRRCHPDVYARAGGHADADATTADPRVLAWPAYHGPAGGSSGTPWVTVLPNAGMPAG